MPNRSRQKGDRVEREIVNTLKELGLEARRQPLSGALPFAGMKGDIRATIPGLGDVTLEVKARKDFKTLTGWLGSHAMLILKPDRKEPLAVMPLAKLLEVLKGSDV